MSFNRFMKWAVIAVGLISVIPMRALPGNIYQEEFKVLKATQSYKALLDRRSDNGVRRVIAGVDNAQEVGLFGRMMRTLLLSQNVIAISESAMPQLSAYVRRVCQQLDMRIPTLYITRDKTSFLGNSNNHSDSTKLAMSAGAILIGQDLLLEVSQEALEAAIAHELCRVKYNHWNKKMLVNWIVPRIASFMLPHETWKQVIFREVSCLVLPRLLLAKRFKKQADRFVYETQSNAEGLIELCTYWQHKEQNVDADYDVAYHWLKESDIALIDYLLSGWDYIQSRTLHRMGKVWRWVTRNTIVGQTQTYQARIDAAQHYLDDRGSQ